MARLSGAALLTAFVLAAPPALAIDTADPARMAREIFGRYSRDGRGFDISGPDARSVLAPGLAALVKADADAAKGEIGALGFDPFCACQDYDITSVKAEDKPTGADKAGVTVSFRDFRKPQTTRLSMVRTAAGWRVADIHTKDTPSLVAYLRKALGR